MKSYVVKLERRYQNADGTQTVLYRTDNAMWTLDESRACRYSRTDAQYLAKSLGAQAIKVDR